MISQRGKQRMCFAVEFIFCFERHHASYVSVEGATGVEEVQRAT
jgi:hypothetical protein